MIQFIYHYLPFGKEAFIKLHKAGVNMLKKLTDHVYYFPHSEETDRPVLGLICGEKYSFIVDAGNSPAHASLFLEEVEKMGVPPIQRSSYYALALGSYIWHSCHEQVYNQPSFNKEKAGLFKDTGLGR
jgi:hypothetical protein